MDELMRLALEAGFSRATALNASTLEPLDAVRDMCAVDRCNMYGHCWTCPPGCGSIEENAAEIAKYSRGIIVQTTRELADDFDHEGMEACGAEHGAAFTKLRDILRAEYPEMLALGAGGCRLCNVCAYPGAPCRFPDRAQSSMEAYGLLVSDVCVKNNLGYYYGPGTMTFTGCFLLS